MVVIGLPPAALVLAGWLAWGGTLYWHDLRRAGGHLHAFRARRDSQVPPALHPPQLQDDPSRCASCLAVLGSTAVEGPVIEWAATHRKHHRYSDRPGGSAQPTRRELRPGGAERFAAWRTPTSAGCSAGRTSPTRSATRRTSLADRDLRFISRTFPLWALVGLAVPFALGFARSDARRRPDRPAVGRCRASTRPPPRDLQHQLAVSLLRRPVRHRRQFRNLAWLAPLAFGEAWHNNHHAFPTSARHGLGRRQFDPSASLIASPGALPGSPGTWSCHQPPARRPDPAIDEPS